MKTIKKEIINLKENLIINQLKTQNSIPITAFLNFEEIDKISKKIDKGLVWSNQFLEVANEWN